MWKGAVLLEDYNGQKELRAEDENGSVSFIEYNHYRWHMKQIRTVAAKTDIG